MRAIVLAVGLLAVSAHADVVTDLLELLPFSAFSAETKEPERRVPGPDEALDRIVRYWSTSYPDEPSDEIRERLLETLDRAPRSVGDVVQYFPVREDVCLRLQPFAADIQPVAHWTLLNCASERERLVMLALQTSDEQVGVGPGTALQALAWSDWSRAEPVLELLAASSDERERALAVSLLYAHEPGDEHRRALQAIAVDPLMHASARGIAFAALANADWEDHDEWLLAQMHDASLLDLSDDYVGYTPVSDAVARDPDRWIPVMTDLLYDDDPIVHSIAANALGRFHLENARADALEPLLPWISDGEWAYDIEMNRERIIQSMARLDMRDAIPHLVHVLAHDEEELFRSYAAEALKDFGHTGEIGLMRVAMQQMLSAPDRLRVIDALLGIGGLSAVELADGIEAFVRRKPTAEPGIPDEFMYSTDLPLDVTIGMRVVMEIDDRDDVAALVIARARELEETEPEIARRMLKVVQTWSGAAADGLRIARLEDGTADAELIWSMLWHRDSVRENLPDALRRIRTAGGWRAGIAAVLESGGCAAALQNDDREAQRAALAAARLLGDPLPLNLVASLFGHTPGLDAAAEAWLMAEDSAYARKLVQQRHPDEVLILGARSAIDFSDTFDAFDRWEAELLRMFRAADADELIALGIAHSWTEDTLPVAVILVQQSKATLTANVDDVMHSAELSLPGLRELRFDDLGVLEDGVGSSGHYEYIHLTRTSGRRVFMNDPDIDVDGRHGELVGRFEALIASIVR